MDITGYSDYIGQAIILRMAMEALTTIIAALFCLTLATFFVYLTGVFLLCRVEDKPRRRPGGPLRCGGPQSVTIIEIETHSA